MSGNNSHSEVPENVSYNFHIRPIFSDKCFACHGPDPAHRKAGLRLDIADSAFAPLKETKGAFALVPGSPDESEVFRRISSTDTSYQMPTPDSHLALLTPYEIALVKKWIKQGAKYEKHWAFNTPVKAPLPKVSDKSWVKNELDYFVLNQLDRMGLKPNEEADKERLFKRINLEITGLLPTPEETAAFVADTDPTVS